MSSTDFFPSPNREEIHQLCDLGGVHKLRNSAYESKVPKTFFHTLPVSSESRIDASEDFLEPIQTPLPICLRCSEFAFFLPSGWLGCLSFALAPIRLLPDYTGSKWTQAPSICVVRQQSGSSTCLVLQRSCRRK